MKFIKRITLLLIVSTALFFTACESRKVASKTPTDARYTPARQEMVTDYEYKYNWWTGDFELVPNIHTQTLPEKYEVYYHIEYTNGDSADSWETVTKSEYDAVVLLLHSPAEN